MVSTLDFESSDPGSNPGRTSFLFGLLVCASTTADTSESLLRPYYDILVRMFVLLLCVFCDLLSGD
jgi:hypothetical protein